MTRGRLLLDEMISPAVARELRARGHDVEAVAERIDLVAASDDEVLRAAASTARAVVTVDISDFAVLDRDWRSQSLTHAGILFVPSVEFPQDGNFVGALVMSLDAAAAEQQLPGPGEVRFLDRKS